MRQKLNVSERRACRAIGQCRSSQRYRPQENAEEKRLVQEMLLLVRQYPRYGYRFIWAKLRQRGWRINRKRVYRLWRREGLKVPQKQHKKRRLGHGENSCVRRKAEHKDHVWTWDFIHDRTCASGKREKLWRRSGRNGEIGDGDHGETRGRGLATSSNSW